MVNLECTIPTGIMDVSTFDVESNGSKMAGYYKPESVHVPTQCGVDLESSLDIPEIISKSVILPSDVTMIASRGKESYDVDEECPDIPIPDGPLDPRALMDLNFIKRILDNLVTPRETRIVLELVVDFVKQETGQCLTKTLEDFKAIDSKLETLDSRHSQLKASVSKSKDTVSTIHRTLSENLNKLKLPESKS